MLPSVPFLAAAPHMGQAASIQFTSIQDDEPIKVRDKVAEDLCFSNNIQKDRIYQLETEKLAC